MFPKYSYLHACVWHLYPLPYWIRLTFVTFRILKEKNELHFLVIKDITVSIFVHWPTHSRRSQICHESIEVALWKYPNGIQPRPPLTTINLAGQWVSTLGNWFSILVKSYLIRLPHPPNTEPPIPKFTLYKTIDVYYYLKLLGLG